MPRFFSPLVFYLKVNYGIKNLSLPQILFESKEKLFYFFVEKRHEEEYNWCSLEFCCDWDFWEDVLM